MRCRYRLIWRPALAEIVGDGRPWTVLMISLLSMLDHHQRDSLVRHFDCVRVPQLVRREASSDARGGGCMM